MTATPVMTIGQPRLEDHGSSVRLAAPIGWPDRTETLWFAVTADHAAALTPDVCDAFLLAMLLPAMRERLDIAIDGAVSARLLYTLATCVMPLAAEVMGGLHPISLRAAEATSRRHGGQGVQPDFPPGSTRSARCWTTGRTACRRGSR